MANSSQHSFDLAHALRNGDINAATAALDLMARDGSKVKPEAVARGRAKADRDAGRIKPLPAIAAA